MAPYCVPRGMSCGVTDTLTDQACASSHSSASILGRWLKVPRRFMLHGTRSSTSPALWQHKLCNQALSITDPCGHVQVVPRIGLNTRCHCTCKPHIRAADVEAWRASNASCIFTVSVACLSAFAAHAMITPTLWREQRLDTAAARPPAAASKNCLQCVRWTWKSS